LSADLQDAELLLRRYGLDRPVVAASAPGSVSAAVCLAHADAAPWLVVASHDVAGHGESTAAPISQPFGTCLCGEVLIAGGIAAHAGAVVVGEIAGITQRVQPTSERAWVVIFAPVAAPASLTVREIGSRAEVLGVAEIEIGPDPSEPRSTLVEEAPARIRRLRSGRFPSGMTSY